MNRPIVPPIDVYSQEICKVAFNRYAELSLGLQFIDDSIDLLCIRPREQTVVSLQNVQCLAAVELTFVDCRLLETEFFHQLLYQVLVPDSASLLLAIDVSMDLQDIFLWI